MIRLPWRGLLASFAVVLACLWAFGEIAERVFEGAPIPLEVPLMQWIHAGNSPGADRVAGFFAAVGGATVMAPVGVLLALALHRLRPHLGAFVVLSLGGTALLTWVMKLVFARPRPSLWVSILPQRDASFPSGHTMMATAFAATIVAVLWSTRWRWPAVAVGAVYVSGMMWSRVYLGVHYPSDVAAGALFSLQWVVVLFRLLPGSRVASTAASR